MVLSIFLCPYFFIYVSVKSKCLFEYFVLFLELNCFFLPIKVSESFVYSGQGPSPDTRFSDISPTLFITVMPPEEENCWILIKTNHHLCLGIMLWC